MTSRTHRKIGELGASKTKYLTLPRDWAAYNFEKGDEVEILYDGILIVAPRGLEGLAERVMAGLRRSEARP